MKMYEEPSKPVGAMASLTWGKLRLLALVAILTLVAAACGGGSEDTGEGGSEAADAASAGGASADGPVTEEEITLTVWSSRDYYVPPDEFVSFMEEYPNITVNWDVQANDDILQQLQRMQDAGQKMPDIIHDDVFTMEAYQQTGLIRPIDDVLERWEEEDPDTYNQLLPIVWEETTIDDQRYGMSVAANFDIYYYNIPWFEEAGVELPFETFDDVYAAMEAMKETRPDGVPMTVQALAGEGVTTLKGMFSASGVPFEGATPDLQSEAALYVIDWFIRAQQDGLLPEEAISWGESEARAAFIQGNAGIINDGITTAGDFIEVGDFDYDDDWGTTLLPTETGQGQSGNLITSSRTWAMTSDVEYPYETSLILRYIADVDNLLEPLQNGSVPPRNQVALDDPRMTEYLPFFTDELREAYLEAGSVPSALNGGEVENVLEQLFGEIVVGTDLTPQELADKYQPELDALNE